MRDNETPFRMNFPDSRQSRKQEKLLGCVITIIMQMKSVFRGFRDLSASFLL
jgi:hypothetical protein